MLSIGEYIKLILRKRNMTITKLAEKMTELERKNGNSETIFTRRLSSCLKHNEISIDRARKIEIALNLPNFQLVNMVNNNLSKPQKERLDNIYKNH